MGKLVVVVGGQYGSEGKGAVAGWLSTLQRDLLAVRVAGPNAGHTVLDSRGKAWKLQHVPVAAVTNGAADLAIAAGSEIEADLLEREIANLFNAGLLNGGIAVDQSATRLEERHSKTEHSGLVDRIGSTGKGVGAARADRIMRVAELWGGDIDVAELARHRLERGGTVLVEGTQGYGLGLHGEHYPQCTSSDCRAIDFLSMAGISPWHPAISQFEVWVVLRTYPIRVAGNSGWMLDEISWDELASRTDGYIQPEQTTVTKKTRRVAEWDPALANEALVANGWPSMHVRVALTFVDYVLPEVANQAGGMLRANPRVHEYIQQIEEELRCPISAVGTGPASMTRWR